MLESFEAFLREKKGISSKYRPYFVKRVADCYAFLKKELVEGVVSGQKALCLRHLETHCAD